MGPHLDLIIHAPELRNTSLWGGSAGQPAVTHMPAEYPRGLIHSLPTPFSFLYPCVVTILSPETPAVNSAFPVPTEEALGAVPNGH